MDLGYAMPSHVLAKLERQQITKYKYLPPQTSPFLE